MEERVTNEVRKEGEEGRKEGRNLGKRKTEKK